MLHIRFSRRPIVLITIILVLIAAPAAAALDGDSETDEPKTASSDPILSVWFDGETGLLIYGATDPTADEPVDCTPPEGVELTIGTKGTDEEGTVEGEVPDGCSTLVIDGGASGISHGTVVSQTVHALKMIRDELDGPFGQYVRVLAQSDFGKEEADGDAEEEAAKAEEEAEKEAAKAERDATKEASKAERDTEKEARQAERDADKADRDAAKAERTVAREAKKAEAKGNANR